MIRKILCWIGFHKWEACNKYTRICWGCFKIEHVLYTDVTPPDPHRKGAGMNNEKNIDTHYCEEPIVCPYCYHKFETRWYIDFGQHHFRFFVGRVFGKLTFNIGLKFVDFGYAWDIKKSYEEKGNNE